MGALLFQKMNDRSTVCLRALACNDAEEAKFCRWLANKKVTTTELLSHCGLRAARAAEGLHVLAIQDTTELNYSAHNRRTHGLGRLDERQNAGFRGRQLPDSGQMCCGRFCADGAGQHQVPRPQGQTAGRCFLPIR